MAVRKSIIQSTRELPASSKWDRVAVNPALVISDEVDVYVDRSTIIRSGNLVTMWDLLDFHTKQTVAGDWYFSSKTHSEYDCKNKQVRELKRSRYAGMMGDGKVIYSNSDTTKWEPITPGTFGETLWKIACGKKFG